MGAGLTRPICLVAEGNTPLPHSTLQDQRLLLPS